MTTAGPWSVKGIDPKAREIAKDLARRSGLTLGEWLNQMITDTGESDAPPPADPWAEPPAPLARGPERASEAVGFGAESFRARLRDAGRAAEAAELQRVARALGDLSTRMEAAEHRSTLAISGIDQQVMGVLSRIEDGERDAAATAARMDGALDEVRSAQEQVAARLARMSEDEGPRAEAMKSLDAALSRMATQIYEGEGRARAQVAEVREDLSGIARRLDAAEASGGGGSQAAQDAFARMAERLDAAEARTSAAVRALEGSFADLDARLKRAESKPDLEPRFAQLAAELNAKVEGARQGMAERLRTAAEDPRLDRMEGVLRDLSGQVGRAEKRSADAIERMGHEVLRIAQSLGGRMDRVEASGAAAVERMGGEMARIAEAVEARAQRGDDLQAQALERLGSEITRIAETLSERIAGSEARSAQALEALGARLDSHADGLSARYDRSAPSRSAFAHPSTAFAPSAFAEETPDDLGSHFSPDFTEDAPDPFAHIGGDEPPAAAPSSLDDFAPPATAEPAPAADPFADYPPFRFQAPEPELAYTPAPQAPAEADAGLFAPPEPPVAADPFEPGRRSSTRDLIEQARAAARQASDGRPTRRTARPLPDLPESPPAGFDPAPSQRGFKLSLPKRRRREGGTLRSIAYASGVAVTITMAAVGAANIASHAPEDPAGSDAPSAAPVETAAVTPATPAPTAAAPASTLAMAVTPLEGSAPAPATDVSAPAPLAAAAPTPDQAHTLYSSGVRRIAGGDPGGVADLRRAADMGLGEAQFHLANLYEEGQGGLKKDPSLARAWMARAAASGEPKAMFNLGLLYANGEGGPQDDRAAVSWFRRAADLGLRDAQFNLAVMNQNGRGAPQSAAEAYKWFLIAAASGDAGARSSADALKGQIAPDALAAAQRSALAWRPARTDASPTA